MDDNKSEVARLLRQIALEYEAAERGLSGVAAVARHDFITARMEAIGRYQDTLQEMVGEREAMRLLAQPSDAREGKKQ